jgi:hypothetical protein
MKLEQHHQQHEAGTTTSSSTKLEQQHHQQHEAGTTTSSTTRSWNNNIINMWQQNEAGVSTTTFVVL